MADGLSSSLIGFQCETVNMRRKYLINWLMKSAVCFYVVILAILCGVMIYEKNKHSNHAGFFQMESRNTLTISGRFLGAYFYNGSAFHPARDAETAILSVIDSVLLSAEVVQWKGPVASLDQIVVDDPKRGQVMLVASYLFHNGKWYLNKRATELYRVIAASALDSGREPSRGTIYSPYFSQDVKDRVVQSEMRKYTSPVNNNSNH